MKSIQNSIPIKKTIILFLILFYILIDTSQNSVYEQAACSTVPVWFQSTWCNGCQARFIGTTTSISGAGSFCINSTINSTGDLDG